MTDSKFNITRTVVTAKSRVLNTTWKMEPWYEDFPVKTITQVTDENTGMIGVHLVRCKSQDFMHYYKWLTDTFGQYGGAWTADSMARRIYFTHEKYYNWFMLQWA